MGLSIVMVGSLGNGFSQPVRQPQAGSRGGENLKRTTMTITVAGMMVVGTMVGGMMVVGTMVAG